MSDREYPGVVTRCFQRYTSEQRADMASSHRLGHRQREAVGEFFYINSMFPGRAFSTRKAALEAAEVVSR